MNQEEYKRRFSQIKAFLESGNYIRDLYVIKSLEAKKEAISFLGDDLIQPSILCGYTD